MIKQFSSDYDKKYEHLNERTMLIYTQQIKRDISKISNPYMSATMIRVQLLLLFGILK